MNELSGGIPPSVQTVEQTGRETVRDAIDMGIGPIPDESINSYTKRLSVFFMTNSEPIRFKFNEYTYVAYPNGDIRPEIRRFSRQNQYQTIIVNAFKRVWSECHSGDELEAITREAERANQVRWLGDSLTKASAQMSNDDWANLFAAIVAMTKQPETDPLSAQ